jgi:hypothetical protein
VITPGSPGDQNDTEGREPYYCIIEMINTSASPVEIGKNVRIGDWEPIDLCRSEESENGVCAGSNLDYEISNVEDSEESREQRKCTLLVKSMIGHPNPLS